LTSTDRQTDRQAITLTITRMCRLSVWAIAHTQKSVLLLAET